MNTQAQLIDRINALLVEGEALRGTKWSPQGNWLGGAPSYVDLESYKTWRCKCEAIVKGIGAAADTWIESFKEKNGWTEYLSAMGELKGLKEAIQAGLLTKASKIIEADIFTSLLEQGEYLLSNGYYIGAGAIFRAVLEEDLRRLTQQKGLIIAKPRPTISDYTNELYKGQIIDKVEMKMIDFVAAIGNDAAHNKPDATLDRVKIMHSDLFRLLTILGQK